MKHFIGILALLFIVIGCTSNTTTVESESRETQIEVSGTGTGEWCPKGSTVNTDSPQGTVSAEVRGVVDSGKYAGYCHMVTSLNMQGQQAEIDYYFDENGSGYQVMDINGQTVETRWHK